MIIIIIKNKLSKFSIMQLTLKSLNDLFLLFFGAKDNEHIFTFFIK